MNKTLLDLFTDEIIVNKIKTRLPKLFQIAELESSRAGKIGMEVGSLREKIIIALLIYKFGEDNLETNIPITEAEIDVKLFNKPISIKTITGRNPSGIKLIWTVDADSAIRFSKNYIPGCDMILVNIVWNHEGYFYYIPIEVQREIFKKLGNERYIKLPKAGTNPRGVEMSKEAIVELANHKFTKRIPIHWGKSEIEYQPYKRWVELWSE
ncbi:MAG TPA: ThaI family type II restriction endonuclease [Ignavibacteria bacterium]